MIKLKEDLALSMISVGAIKFGEFKLKLHEKNPDAPLSPIYIDLRVLRSVPLAMKEATAVLGRITRELKFDVIADVPTAGTPFATFLSFLLEKPMITPRTDQKKHGTGLKIDGIFKMGQVALLVDDLITTADSKLEAITILEQNGVLVNDVLVLVDRQQGGCEALAREDYLCHAVFGLRELLDFYLGINMIDEQIHKKVIDYLER